MFDTIFDTGLETECEKCKGYKEAKNPCLKYYGTGKNKILIVIDGPTEQDDYKGKVLSGTTRAELSRHFRNLDLNIDDFWVTSGVKCFSKKKSEKKIKHCRKLFQKEMKDLKPKAVFAMGTNAVDVVCGEHIKNNDAFLNHGYVIPYMDTWVVPMLPASFLVEKNKDKNLEAYYKRTLKKILRKIEKKPEVFNYTRDIKLITTMREFDEFYAEWINYEGAYSFDYETTGLKPYEKGHKITVMSVTFEDMRTFAFPVQYRNHWKKDESDVMDRIANQLAYTGNFKIAHNLQFETTWTKEIFSVDPKIDWCSMTQQHLVDTRKGNTSLKAQAFLRWGVHSYDAESDKYKTPLEGEIFNRMEEMPLPEQLMYCAIDSKLTMKLFLEQEKELVYNERGSKFYNSALKTLNDITYNGIHIDIDWFNFQRIEVTKQIKELEEELYESQEVIKHMNRNHLKEWSYTSNQDVKALLVDSLHLEIKGVTDKGEVSMDEKSLTECGHWIAEHILKLRKLLKVRTTYIDGILANAVNGVLRPDFTLHIARSLRSSSKNPNFQNFPKRNKETKKIVRRGFKPSKGNRLVEVDFSGIEVSTSALYHKDPTFLNYLVDDTADMHRDNAADIWMTTGDDISKDVRFYAKNCWTFPQFYGDYYASCAEALWENRFEKLKSGLTCVEHIKRKGITTYAKFVDHLKKCEDILWNKRFPVYTKWKNEFQANYQNNGYIETYFGFRFNALLNKKQICNYPIQGTAFHIMLWCLTTLNNMAKKEGWKTKFVGQIHDSMVIDLCPAEEKMVMKRVKEVCEVWTKRHFTWLITPFRVDIEISGVDGNFDELTEYKMAA